MAPATFQMSSGSPKAAPTALIVRLYERPPTITADLIEHAHGGSARRVQTPRDNGVFLLSVSGTSPSNVWAVGESASRSGGRPLAFHYGGAHWVATRFAHPGYDSIFDGVAAGGQGANWAVGSYTKHRGIDGALHEIWDGKSWVVR